MAVEHKQVLADIKNAPLSEEELKVIKTTEDYIDKEIRKQFDGGDVHIDLTIATLKYDINKKIVTNLKEIRRVLMYDELIRRYKKAGWKFRIEYDDGLDGPNMSGPSYWILSGKSK